ncbi:MAG: lysylphosphatidylglycerol synthase transmembrane domain-containing protein [Candidatus Binataceae bacterium]
MQAEPAVGASPAQSPISAPPRKGHPVLGFALRAIAGLAIVTLLLWHYDMRPVLHQLARERVDFFIAVVAIYVAGQVMSAWRWSLLGAILKIPAPFIDYLAYGFIGMFTNVFVPGLVGGDALRAVYLGRRHQRLADAIASVAADRIVGLIGLFWLAGTAAAALSVKLPRSVILPTIAVGAISLACFAALPLIGKLAARMPARIAGVAATVAPYLDRPLAMMPAIGLSIVLQLSLAVCQWILARGLGLSAPLTLFVLCVPIANVFASLPVTLNGLGVRETAYLMLFGMAGMAKADAIALGLLWFAATALGNLTGVVAFALTETPPLRAASGEQA